nr:MAG TPA: hypothetical protein [Caudoviricetes sp.]
MGVDMETSAVSTHCRVVHSDTFHVLTFLSWAVAHTRSEALRTTNNHVVLFVSFN